MNQGPANILLLWVVLAALRKMQRENAKNVILGCLSTPMESANKAVLLDVFLKIAMEGVPIVLQVQYY